jgi:hypothetical protein
MSIRFSKLGILSTYITTLVLPRSIKKLILTIELGRISLVYTRETKKKERGILKMNWEECAGGRAERTNNGTARSQS